MLTNVVDKIRLTIALSGLNGTGTASASLGFLVVGDVTNSRAVNAADIAAVKANLNKPLDNTTTSSISMPMVRSPRRTSRR